MFTGIIEASGIITEITSAGTNKTFWVKSSISKELKVDQSVSHSGVCLTVEEVEDDFHRVTAIEETISRTNLGDWKTGDLVNLERCMMLSGRLDGHIVQGHVDATALCTEKSDMGGSWKYRFQFPDKFTQLIIEKGSVTLNGISLTIVDAGRTDFSVAIIPYTFEHTNINAVNINSYVNIEFDVIGKYAQRRMNYPI